MNITLKNCKLALSLSEETIAFTADLYVDGVKTGYASNHGTGGPTGYYATPAQRERLSKAEAYALTLPAHSYGDFTVPSSLELVIDLLVDGEVKKKEAKKLEKDMQKSLLFGTADEYTCVSWRLPLTEMLTNPKGLEVVAAKVKQLRAAGKVILNTNLPTELLITKA